jgi:hypothetical protein
MKIIFGRIEPATLSEHATEYVTVLVRAEGGAEPVTTAAAVWLAFIPDGGNRHGHLTTGSPQPADWVPAEWESADKTVARCLVGPHGPTAPRRGDYTVWVRIEVPPENAIRSAGKLRIH